MPDLDVSTYGNTTKLTGLWNHPESWQWQPSVPTLSGAHDPSDVQEILTVPDVDYTYDTPDAYKNMIMAESGLVGYWRTRVDASGFTLQDLVNGRNGTVNAPVRMGMPGLIVGSRNTSCYLDGVGDGTGTGYISIPDASDFSIITTGKLTVECWFYATIANAGCALVGKSNNTGQYEWAIEQWSLNDRITSRLWTLGGAGIGSVDGSVLSVPGLHHIVALYDYTGLNQITHYLDTSTAVTGGSNPSALTGVPADGTGTVNIGQRGDTSEYWNGGIQEIAIYNVLLNTDQIRHHYLMGLGRYLPNIRRVSQAVNRGTY